MSKSETPYKRGLIILCRFQVFNQRYPTVFLYFSNITSVGFGNVAWSSSRVTAVSPPIAVNPNEPTQGHLTFTSTQG